MSNKYCPRCDLEMELVSAEPDVGIMSSYYYCDHCDITTDCEPPDLEDDYHV